MCEGSGSPTSLRSARAAGGSRWMAGDINHVSKARPVLILSRRVSTINHAHSPKALCGVGMPISGLCRPQRGLLTRRGPGGETRPQAHLRPHSGNLLPDRPQGPPGRAFCELGSLVPCCQHNLVCSACSVTLRLPVPPQPLPTFPVLWDPPSPSPPTWFIQRPPPTSQQRAQQPPIEVPAVWGLGVRCTCSQAQQAHLSLKVSALSLGLCPLVLTPEPYQNCLGPEVQTGSLGHKSLHLPQVPRRRGGCWAPPWGHGSEHPALSSLQCFQAAPPSSPRQGQGQDPRPLPPQASQELASLGLLPQGAGRASVSPGSSPEGSKTLP